MIFLTRVEGVGQHLIIGWPGRGVGYKHLIFSWHHMWTAPYKKNMLLQQQQKMGTKVKIQFVTNSKPSLWQNSRSKRFIILMPKKITTNSKTKNITKLKLKVLKEIKVKILTKFHNKNYHKAKKKSWFKKKCFILTLTSHYKFWPISKSQILLVFRSYGITTI